MDRKKIFISGGAGFIGSNLAKYYYDLGHDILVYDNLSRKGTEVNIKWLAQNSKGKGLFKFVKGDILNLTQLKKNIKGADIIYHMAAQVAVTTSLTNPTNDFEINAKGTFNMLEAYRLISPDAIFVYASTNKVYGGLDELECIKKGKRYVFAAKAYKNGIAESRLLDFHSPYGCSKGAGDQYVRDYGRVYRLKTIVFRQSCIYGPRQFGNEDQGWVMHFVRTVLSDHKLKIYGDGYQVRDLLHVSDLIDAYERAIKVVKKGQGLVYNVGGGLANSTSLLEVVSALAKKTKMKIPVSHSAWREGDQKIYISDNSKIMTELSWKPKITVEQGLDDLIVWAKEMLGK
jgi:CDP-paratose 2-epimerase